MNPTLLSSPAGEFVLRLTILLCVAWLAQAGFAAQHARWRLLLWRSVLVLGLLIPLARLEFWGRLMIPVEAPEVARLFISEGLEKGTAAGAGALESASGGVSASSPGATITAASTLASTLADTGEAAGAFPWAGLWVWLAGGAAHRASPSPGGFGARGERADAGAFGQGEDSAGPVGFGWSGVFASFRSGGVAFCLWRVATGAGVARAFADGDR